MREACRITIYVNTAHEYMRPARRLVKRRVERLGCHEHYQRVEVGRITLNTRRIVVYRRAAGTTWTSFLEEVVRYDDEMEADHEDHLIVTNGID